LQIGHFCAHRFSQQRQGGAGVGQLQLLAGQVVGGDGQIFRVGQVGLRQLAIDLYRFLRGGQPLLTAAKVGVTGCPGCSGLWPETAVLLAGCPPAAAGSEPLPRLVPVPPAAA
jgi:hypothetical protein